MTQRCFLPPPQNYNTYFVNIFPMAGTPVHLIYKLRKGGLSPSLSGAPPLFWPRCWISTKTWYPPWKLSNAHTVIGHSMSKGIKKMSKTFTGCCLLLPLIILIKLWNSHAKRVAGLWRQRALGDLGAGEEMDPEIPALWQLLFFSIKTTTTTHKAQNY